MSAAATLEPAGPLALACDDSEGDGVPVLFVHGFGHNRVVWAPIAAALAPRHRTIAVDLRGHGASPWSPEGHYDLDDYAGDLRALADRLRLDDFHVVGHSLGGNVSTLFAASVDARVRSLCLVDTGPSLKAAGAQHVLGEIGDALRPYDAIDGYRRQLALMHPFAEGGLLDRLAERSLVRRLDGRYELALDPGVLGPLDGRAAETDVEAIEARLWAALDGLSRPVFVARGERSSILDEATERRILARAATGSRSQCFAGAGHALMIDAAAPLADAIAGFLDAVDGR